jgi:hypothetical protein
LREPPPERAVEGQTLHREWQRRLHANHFGMHLEQLVEPGIR